MNSTATLEVPTIGEALQNGLLLIKQDKWRYHQSRSLECGFMRWMAETNTQIKTWWELKPMHLFNYTSWMEDHMGWNSNTVNHYFNPIRKASLWVHLNYPDKWTNLFIRKLRRNASELTPDYYLMPDQLATVVRVARLMDHPQVVAAAMFGGLAGLGIAEMCDLQAEHITERTITVVREKNAYRPRVIPMVEPLKAYAEAFKTCFGRIPGRRVEVHLNKRGRKVLDGCFDETGDETFLKVDLHQSTRVTFSNIAKIAGVPNEYLSAMMGHCGNTVLERSYLKLIPRKNDLPRIQEAKLIQLESNVIEPINNLIKDFAF